MEEYKGKRIYVLNYICILINASLCLACTALFESHKFVPYILIITGIYIVFKVYIEDKLLMTPISIFSIIWLIFVPICSFEYPLMREMSNFEWEIVLSFLIAFSLGSIIAGNMKKIKLKSRKKLNNFVIKVNYAVIIFSSISLVVLFAAFGGIPLFQDDANTGKEAFRNGGGIFNIFNLVSYFGAAAMLVLFLDDITVIKSKKYVFLLLIYIALLVLSGERFFVTCLIVLVMFSFCKNKVDKKFLKRILLIILCILAIFLFILQFRGNAEQKEKYFIETGIYQGNVQNLTSTEFFRYLGMQERVLTQTFEDVTPGISKGTLTISPILKLFGISPITTPDIQIYGYTAKTIITKTYFDFGNFWTFAIVILAFIINVAYMNFSKEKSLFSQYVAILFLMLLLFSFYAYFDNLIIFFLHFIIYIIFIEIINNIRRKI